MSPACSAKSKRSCAITAASCDCSGDPVPLSAKAMNETLPDPAAGAVLNCDGGAAATPETNG
jgi:hypothetical protein